MSTTEKYKLFSKRTRHGEAVDVYQYDNLPEAFRNQVVFIWQDTVGLVARWIRTDFDTYDFGERISLNFFGELEATLQREYGLLQLSTGDTCCIRVGTFFRSSDADRALDVIELAFRLLPVFHAQRKQRSLANLRLTPQKAIVELNDRFREHGIGYRFENDLLIRIDSEYLHGQVVQPTLQLLHDLKFKGALNEFTRSRIA